MLKIKEIVVNKVIQIREERKNNESG
jgi:hypothetical protein